MSMQILPVLDLLNGVVVRGVAGQRETYRPIKSLICPSAEPGAIAQSFRDHFGLNRLYVADLDAIVHRRPNFTIYGQLAAAGHALLVDAGIQDLAAARNVLNAGADSLIAGLESVPDPELLRSLVAEFGALKILFSLDLQGGQPLVGAPVWAGMNALDIVRCAVDHGIERLIVLDLAQVGVADGLSTLELCAAIRLENPELELITGGGVRNQADLQLLRTARVDGVLIASALHSGQISRSDLDRLA